MIVFVNLFITSVIREVTTGDIKYNMILNTICSLTPKQGILKVGIKRGQYIISNEGE